MQNLARSKENLEKSLKKANREIEHLQGELQEKDMEVSFIVHDLKSPLSVIEMNFSIISEALKEHEEFSKYTKITSLIESQIVSMRQLILELLNISKMENQKRELELSEVNASLFLNETFQKNKDIASNNAMNLQTSIEGELGLLFLDKGLIERVFANLIMNAIKYSVDSEEIILRASKSTLPDHICFAVQDFGAGIPKASLKKVFERFEHSKANDSTKRVSHGLGLYFSKLAVELHGGTIWAESIEGKGSTFFFNLPLKPPLEA